MADRNPELSALLVAHGFAIESTGGNCTAWTCYFSGCWAMVTVYDGAEHDVDTNDWLLGIYDEEHCEGFRMFEPRTLQTRCESEKYPRNPDAVLFASLADALTMLALVRAALLNGETREQAIARAITYRQAQ